MSGILNLFKKCFCFVKEQCINTANGYDTIEKNVFNVKYSNCFLMLIQVSPTHFR